MRLHPKNDYVLGARRGVISGRSYARHRFLGAIGMNEPDTLGLQRFEIRAPGDERHFLAGEREPGANIAADCAHADDRDFHRRTTGTSHALPTDWRVINTVALEFEIVDDLFDALHALSDASRLVEVRLGPDIAGKTHDSSRARTLIWRAYSNSSALSAACTRSAVSLSSCRCASVSRGPIAQAAAPHATTVTSTALAIRFLIGDKALTSC